MTPELGSTTTTRAEVASCGAGDPHRQGKTVTLMLVGSIPPGPRYVHLAVGETLSVIGPAEEQASRPPSPDDAALFCRIGATQEEGGHTVSTFVAVRRGATAMVAAQSTGFGAAAAVWWGCTVAGSISRSEAKRASGLYCAF
ncbi:MAG: hypothetical protein ACRDYD_12105 [Acidimicrobiales bacterium]